MNRFIIGFYSLIGLLFFSHCKKSKNKLPLVTTSTFEVKLVSAKIVGVLYEEGDAKVTEKGICWGSTPGVSITNNKVISTVNEKSFIVEVTGLEYEKTYFARAYAISEHGVSYGKEISFKTWNNNLLYIDMSLSMASQQPDAVSIGVTLQLKQQIKATFTTGICWSTSMMPSVLNNTISVMERFDNDAVPFTNSYQKTFQNLDENTIYYFRAFSTDGVSVAYSNQLSLQTANPIDIVSLNSLSISNAAITCKVSNIDVSKINTVGICWSVNELPTIGDNKQEQSYSSTTYSKILTPLNPATTYYVRAFITVNAKTIYSPQLAIRTYKGTVTDIDGNLYYTVQIGNQEWMAGNLKTTRYNDGSTIQYATDYNQWVSSINSQSPVYCYYADQPSYDETYGKLYPSYVGFALNIAPVGWRVATVADWQKLFAYNSMFDLWNSGLSLTGNINRLSLSAGGYRGGGYSYANILQKGFFWAALGASSYNCIVVNETSNLLTWYPDGYGCSIRCIKN